MRIKNLKIGNYKNLKNLSIDFDEKSFTSVIVGQNGTGKSNILEAIILIFRDLDLGVRPSFKYQIEYKCNGNIINIRANPERERNILCIKINDNKISNKKFNELKKGLYLPNYVFGYYSGTSNRMERLFEPHQNRFYTELISKNLINDIEKPLRPLLYARHIHSQFALLAFFYEKDEIIKKFLKDYLSIEGFDSVLFIIKEPPWDSNDGDPRFWNARGAVQQLLSSLYEISIAPLRMKQEVHVDFRKRSNQEHLYLYIKDCTFQVSPKFLLFILSYYSYF